MRGRGDGSERAKKMFCIHPLLFPSMLFSVKTTHGSVRAKGIGAHFCIYTELAFANSGDVHVRAGSRLVTTVYAVGVGHLRRHGRIRWVWLIFAIWVPH